MKVKELIEKLQALSDEQKDLPVCAFVDCCECSNIDIEEIWSKKDVYPCELDDCIYLSA